MRAFLLPIEAGQHNIRLVDYLAATVHDQCHNEAAEIGFSSRSTISSWQGYSSLRPHTFTIIPYLICCSDEPTKVRDAFLFLHLEPQCPLLQALPARHPEAYPPHRREQLTGLEVGEEVEVTGRFVV
jgi:hypothetical protein